MSPEWVPRLCWLITPPGRLGAEGVAWLSPRADVPGTFPYQPGAAAPSGLLPGIPPLRRGRRLLVPTEWHSPESVTAPPSEAIICDRVLHDYYFHGLLNAPKNKV